MKPLPYKEIPTTIINYPNKDEFVRRVQLANEPFKVTGRIEHWSLTRTMAQLKDPIDQCDYLATLLPKEKIYYTVLPFEQQGQFGLNSKLEQNFSFKSRKAFFPEFADQVKRYLWNPLAGTLYLQSTEIKTLVDKLGSLDLFDGFSPVSCPRFWIGTGSQFIGLHNDPSRNIIALFTGRKRVIMFPPEELPNIYPAPFDKHIGGVFASLVNAHNPDLEKFPRFQKALEKVRVAIINPGEFLYIPPLWWHAVEGEGFNVGLNCWFYDDGKQDKIRSTYLPALPLLWSLNTHFISKDKREYLCTKFIESIEADTELKIPKGTHGIELKTLKAAKKIRSSIVENSLSTNQKNIWRKWVCTFASWYLFLLEENPFPTLSSNEFNNMVKRMKKNSNTWFNIFCLSFYINYLFLIIFLMKKKIKRHGIVPLQNDTSLKTMEEYVIFISANEILSTFVINPRMGGAFIYHKHPPVLGMNVKISISDQNMNVATVRGVVNWVTNKKTEENFRGFGMKWTDTSENIDVFIKQLPKQL